jgi:hypothetical protein
MTHERFLEELNQEIKPDRNYAQILIKNTNYLKTFEDAKKIIEDLGVHIIETKHLSFDWILLKLDAKDMRNIVLKLTENGFFEIRGYNALSLSI